MELGTLVSKPAKPAPPYPQDVAALGRRIADAALAVCARLHPDVVVVEDTNPGGRAGRRSQKVLEFAHAYFVEDAVARGWGPKLRYLSTSDWRKALGVTLTEAEKAQNRQLTRLRRASKVAGEVDQAVLRQKKKEAGVSGKITPKHAAVRFVNARLGTQLSATQDDAAEAACLALAAICLGSTALS